jgi:CheY-like chemotaxis protein
MNSSTVFEATTGKQALAILRREKSIRLLITDQAMPHMTGVQLADTVRVGWPNLPIVVATGYAELPPEAGANVLMLAKPFRAGDLEKVIAKAPRIEPPSSGVLQFPRADR